MFCFDWRLGCWPWLEPTPTAGEFVCLSAAPGHFLHVEFFFVQESCHGWVLQRIRKRVGRRGIAGSGGLAAVASKHCSSAQPNLQLASSRTASRAPRPAAASMSAVKSPGWEAARGQQADIQKGSWVARAGRSAAVEEARRRMLASMSQSLRPIGCFVCRSQAAAAGRC